MPKSRDYEMAIKIAGEIEKSFYDSTKLTKKEMQEIARQAARTAAAASESSASMWRSIDAGLKNAKPAFDGLESIAKTSFKAITAAAAAAGAAITAGIGASVSVGSEFESAFAGVKKTVNASDAELAQMRDDIRQMAKEMPSTAAELSEIAESAGQLGIRTENITEFTKTMADLAVATNLSSDEGASEFAKFANIVEMSQDKFDELGSTVVALGNNMATTEADIVAMGMRIAAAGSQIGLSEDQIMGYSAALSSVGIEAEAGGTAFSKLLVNLQMAAETGEDLKEYAKVAGMTGQEFKKAFQEDAATAINAFLSGLNDTERNGKSAIAVLTDMGLKEVRLRDTLLRAAGASDMFGDALSIANTAWEENTALAKEAAQRYETYDSQMDILGNKTKDIGISVYDDLKPALTETIGLANDFIDGIAGQEDVLGDMIESATKAMPTMVREAREAAETMSDFAAPFLRVGGWLADNPGLLVGTIAGVGGALGTYKIATGISSIVTALGSLGPAGLAVMGIGGVVGVIAGIRTEIKKSAEEAKRANLQKHFGNISLSLKDLRETAAYIVRDKNLEKINESVSAMGELDGISEQISAAMDALNKSNWKVSVGMELTDQEKEDYRKQIESFVQSTQDYVTQQQYAVTMSVGTLLGDDLESSNVVDQVNAFYADKQKELSDLGTKLNQTITDAFTDGLLDIDEVEEITKLQEQMAKIQSAMAGNDFEAGLNLLEMKYGGSLDSDSFVNLQSEVQSELDAATEAYNEAFRTAASKQGIMRDEGAISKAEYEANMENLQAGYREQLAVLQSRAAEFLAGTVMDAYGDEMGGLLEMLQKETGNALGSTLEGVAQTGTNVNMDQIGKDVMKAVKGNMDRSTRDSFAELYEQMQPLLGQLQEMEQQYREAGEAIPESLRNSLQDVSRIGALSGDMDAMWEVIGRTAESPEYQETLEAIQSAGGYIPDQIADAIGGGQYKIDSAVEQSWRQTQDAIWNVYGGSAFEIPVHIKAADAPYSNEYLKNSSLAGHASGGIFDVPHLAWFAENGPEAAIPLDGSENAISLWERTGELLGMDGISGGESNLAADAEEAAGYAGRGMEIYYNPTLQFYGEAPDRQDIEEALESEQEKFARMMGQWMRENARTKFY